MALYINGDKVIYLDSFGAEYISNKIKTLTGNKSIRTNIYRIQANDWIMCRYFCLGSIDLVFKGKKLLDYTNLFSPY